MLDVDIEIEIDEEEAGGEGGLAGVLKNSSVREHGFAFDGGGGA